MWFKNLCAYRFLEPFTLSAEELEEKLAAAPFTPCGSMDMSSRGWVSPMGQEGAQLVHSANGIHLLALREEDFVLAARLVGSSEMRIILRHMVPSFLSYIIATLTLAIPGMILAETGLEPTLLSQHLGVLKRHQVVRAERTGNTVRYELANPKVADLLVTARSFLADVLGAQRDQWEAFQALPPIGGSE